MIYCGLDMSTTSTGVGILEDDVLIHYECIKPKSKDWQERIGIIYNRLDEIFNEYNIEQVYIEDIPLKDGKPTLMKLATVRGALICVCYKHNIPFKALKVNEWRENAGFFDGTQKGLKREEMKKKAIKEVNKVFNIDVNDDIAEGILIAYYYQYPKKHGFGKRKK